MPDRSPRQEGPGPSQTGLYFLSLWEQSCSLGSGLSVCKHHLPKKLSGTQRDVGKGAGHRHLLISNHLYKVTTQGMLGGGALTECPYSKDLSTLKSVSSLLGSAVSDLNIKHPGPQSTTSKWGLISVLPNSRPPLQLSQADLSLTRVASCETLLHNSLAHHTYR